MHSSREISLFAGSKRHIVAGLAVALLSLSGCFGSGDKSLAPVTGTVKAKGKIVTAGKIMFYPDAGGRPAMGAIGPDGTYSLKTNKDGDCASIGTHTVTFNCVEFRGGGGGDDIFDTGPGEKMIWIIPEKFSDPRSTTVKATVESGNSNVIDFDSAEF